MVSRPDRPSPNQTFNMRAALPLLPIGATVGYYWLPSSLREELLVQFIPQLLAYLAMGLWASRTFQVPVQLGLEKAKVGNGLKWGLITGLLLGCLNTFVILSVYPSLGYDITFLKQTPHGRLPVLLMVPWFICGIALFVELNFRGIHLGPACRTRIGLVWNTFEPTPFSPCVDYQHTRVCLRSLHGEYVSLSPLDCVVGWIHLGSHLAANTKPLDYHCCARGRSPRDV